MKQLFFLIWKTTRSRIEVCAVSTVANQVTLNELPRGLYKADKETAQEIYISVTAPVVSDLFITNFQAPKSADWKHKWSKLVIR